MSPLADPEITDFRIERKYRLEGATQAGVQALLGQLPAAVQRAFPDRWVNSLYFDDPDLGTALDNLRGVGDRRKYRLRWYGDWLAEGLPLHFEVKERRNQGIRKFNFYDIPQNLPEWLAGKEQPPVASSILSPVVGIRYQRSYFHTFDRQIRLTIDWELQAAAWQANWPMRWMPMSELILEVKYPMEQEERAMPLLEALPFRPDRHSKYLRAV
ncbi:MAG: VTC domain-containing protein, partial [Phaeodactylibacter sp.]|nr:VTC domain-containing protein [Phaeodactylibacter sp.]